jgi:hypothetical protein
VFTFVVDIFIPTQQVYRRLSTILHKEGAANEGQSQLILSRDTLRELLEMG